MNRQQLAVRESSCILCHCRYCQSSRSHWPILTWPMLAVTSPSAAHIYAGAFGLNVDTTCSGSLSSGAEIHAILLAHRLAGYRQSGQSVRPLLGPGNHRRPQQQRPRACHQRASRPRLGRPVGIHSPKAASYPPARM